MSPRLDMGDDMAALVKALGHPTVDVFGYSMGGAVALRMAIQHPQSVRRLALLSAGFAQDGFYPEMLPQQAAVGAAMAGMMLISSPSLSGVCEFLRKRMSSSFT